MTAAGFRPEGVGSALWFVQTIKANRDRRGYTYLKELSGVDGLMLTLEEVQNSVQRLLDAGYIRKVGNLEKPKTLLYEVTSFGHRYLEDNRDRLDVPSDLQKKEFTVPEAPAMKSPFTATAAPTASSPISPTATDMSTSATINLKDPSLARIGRGLKAAAEALDPVAEKVTKLPPDERISIPTIKRITGEILFDKHAGEVSVLDLIERIEGGGDE